MMELSNILLGSLLLIASILYTFNLIKKWKTRERKDYPDYWDSSMFFGGLIGGISVMVGIIILLLNECSP